MSRRWKRAKPRSGTAAQEGESGRLEPCLSDGQAGRRWKAAALLAAVVVVFVAAGAVGLVLLARSPASPPKALIADQLDQTFPNPAFAEEAGALLRDAGYDVYYTPGSRVTVDFYRGLASRDYQVIVLRVHVARLWDPTTEAFGDAPVLFTSEPYSTAKYVKDQRAWRMGSARYYPGGEPYFGILPAFFTSVAKGNFGGATVILMGCGGLRSDAIAKALVDKGAKEVIGWDGSVSADHTDAATERLLQHLAIDKLGPQEAVTRTMSEIGPDPAYGSNLVLYPAEAAASAGP